MNTNGRSLRRIAAIAGATTITAITMTYAVQPASATTEPGPDRPCFIIQARWNTAIDGPQPTCPAPIWERASAPFRTDAQPRPVGSGTRNRMDFGDEYAAGAHD